MSEKVAEAPKITEFKSVGEIRRFLSFNGVSNRDFLVNQAGIMVEHSHNWEVIITNPEALDSIKRLLEKTDSGYRVVDMRPNPN